MIYFVFDSDKTNQGFRLIKLYQIETVQTIMTQFSSKAHFQFTPESLVSVKFIHTL